MQLGVVFRMQLSLSAVVIQLLAAACTQPLSSIALVPVVLAAVQLQPARSVAVRLQPALITAVQLQPAPLSAVQ